MNAAQKLQWGKLGFAVIALAIVGSFLGDRNKDYDRQEYASAEDFIPSPEYDSSANALADLQKDALIAELPSSVFGTRAGETYAEFNARRSTYVGSRGTFHGYGCTVDCSGHEAGYEWAEENMIDDPDDCVGNSFSFEEGCIAYLEENEPYSLGSAGARLPSPISRSSRSGLTANKIGGTTIYGDGTTSNRIGNTTIFSDGTTASRIGNTTIFSDGRSASQIGNTTIYSDGTTASRIGDTTIFSDGTSCNTIGTTTICN